MRRRRRPLKGIYRGGGFWVVGLLRCADGLEGCPVRAPMVESPGTRCVKHGMRATALGVAVALRLSSYGLVRRKLLSLLVCYRPLAHAG